MSGYLRLRSLLIASYYHDGYILGDYLRTPGIDPMSTIFELLWRDADLQPLPATDLPLSRYMGYPYGWMVARTGWDANSVIAEMKVNALHFGGHQHRDGGAFQIYYKGPLAIDSGLYEGTNGDYGGAHHQNYYQRTIAHNSLLIFDPDETFAAYGHSLRNDGGQKLPNDGREAHRLEQLLAGRYRTGAVLGEGFGPDPRTPEYTYLKGDLTDAYSKKVREVKRSFVFLNLVGSSEAHGVPAALILFDKVVAAKAEFKKYWLLHSMVEPEVRGTSTIVSLNQRGWSGKLTQTTLLPESSNATISKVGGPGQEFWVFGENFPNQPAAGEEERDFEMGAWRIELSPRKPEMTDYFLNVLEIGDTQFGKSLSIEKISSATLVGVRLANRVVMFQKESERTDHRVSFTVAGTGKLRFLVTDLAEGTWQIWCDGKIFAPAMTVTHDAGTAYFEGPAGTWELRR